MQEISFLTKSIDQITDAIQGKWDRHSEKGAVWAILGRIVLVEGDKSKFPLDVINWHTIGSLSIGILGKERIENVDPTPTPEQIIADIAKVLQTPRRLTVNLSNDTTATYFDGSEDVDIQVTGTLDKRHIDGLESLLEHLNDYSNPHRVTAAQVGAYSAMESDNKFATNDALTVHTSNHSNPHQVTAEQVGTYDKDTIDTKISEAASGAGHFLGTITPQTLNMMIAQSLVNINDSADMSGAGTVVWTGGSLAVEKYDSIILSTTGWLKRAKAKWGIDVSNETFTIVSY